MGLEPYAVLFTHLSRSNDFVGFFFNSFLAFTYSASDFLVSSPSLLCSSHPLTRVSNKLAVHFWAWLRRNKGKKQIKHHGEEPLRKSAPLAQLRVGSRKEYRNVVYLAGCHDTTTHFINILFWATADDGKRESRQGRGAGPSPQRETLLHGVWPWGGRLGERERETRREGWRERWMEANGSWTESVSVLLCQLLFFVSMAYLKGQNGHTPADPGTGPKALQSKPGGP